MQTVEQNLSDEELGAKRIKLTLAPETPVPTQGTPVLVLCDYSAADARGGVVLPLSLQIVDPDGQTIVYREFSRMAPISLELNATRPGVHLVRLGELFHNRWFGSLQVSVRGEDEGEG